LGLTNARRGVKFPTPSGAGQNPLTRLRQLTDWRNRRRGPPSPPKGARGIVKDCVGTTLMTNGATNPKEN